MFVRLLVCAGFLAFLCFGLMACGDEDPQIVKEVAELVETVPASGERAAAHQPVMLYFDKEPLAVTVNGTAARVEGNSAFWVFSKARLRMEMGYFILNGQTPMAPRMLVQTIRLTVVIS